MYIKLGCNLKLDGCIWTYTQYIFQILGALMTSAVEQCTEIVLVHTCVYILYCTYMCVHTILYIHTVLYILPVLRTVPSDRNANMAWTQIYQTINLKLSSTLMWLSISFVHQLLFLLSFEYCIYIQKFFVLGLLASQLPHASHLIPTATTTPLLSVIPTTPSV